MGACTPGGSRTLKTPDPKSGDFSVCPQRYKNKNPQSGKTGGKIHINEKTYDILYPVTSIDERYKLEYDSTLNICANLNNLFETAK